jgi:RNase H-like domain found in reverse transcriptase/Chromo (CHRromatin Organisation MOdifier) domain
MTSKELCQPFIRTGSIITSDGTLPIFFTRFLLDTGAQGSNFISNKAYLTIPITHLQDSRAIDRVVRLGDARHLSVQLEVLLQTSIADSTGLTHSRNLWYSVLPELSHDVIIGLVDLIGPYYDLFEDAVQHSRTLSVQRDSATQFSSLSPGQMVQPWSHPIDAIAPEEHETPDPTSFPDDILTYLTTTVDEAQTIYRADLSTHVTPEMQAQCPEIMDLLQSQLAYDVFVPSTWSGINMPPYHLDVKPGLPDHMKAHARPVRAALFHDAKAEFDRMKTYFYEKSNSPIACPLVVAPKATAPFIRLCGDYRPINPFISIPQEPIPHVQQSLSKAAGWQVFVDLDMTNSFHQIPIDDFSSNLLSVSTPWGLFRPKFLPEGVGPASGILQSIVRRVFADFDDWTIVIFDNFLILASDYTDAYQKLQLILERCQQHKLILKMKKSWIGTTLVTFFGYEVHPGSWQLSTSRKSAIAAMLFPTTQKQMQSFLGAANFFHTHIPNYASWASSLYECTVSGFNWNPATWKKDYKTLFTVFQTAIQDATTLYFPDYSLPWILRSDASDHAVGAVLFQEFTDSTGAVIHQPIAFVSHKFSRAAVNWDTFKQEAYGLYFGVIKLSYYLRGKEFVAETDHRNLLWIESSQVPIVVRWRVLLQSFNFTVKHIPGKDNTVADWLSRMYPDTADVILHSIIATPSLQDMFDCVHGGRSLHHGAKRTYLALCARYPGHGIPLRVIQDLVSECPICQKDRLPLHPIPHNNIQETLMHHTRTIGMDHVSVTPADEDGYIALLLIVELDTKFPQAYPVRDYTALTVAIVLFRHYCTFGTYDAIFSDPGSAFTSEVVTHLNQWLGVAHRISVVGRHESNGTEHVNALFMGHLRRLVHDERLSTRWASDTVLPLINHALATMPNSELGGLTPAELKFGTVDFKRFSLPPPLVPGTDYSSLVIQLDNNLAIVRAITNNYQSELRSSRQAPTPGPTQNKFQPGDLILWNPKEHPHSFRSSKLAPKLLGPFEVIKQNKNDVSCRHIITQKPHILHADRLTPFIGDASCAQQVALLDNDEYIVEKILRHTGDFKRLGSLRFLVRWLSYTSADDSWEPWLALRHVQALHDYLRLIGKSLLIPSAHRI